MRAQSIPLAAAALALSCGALARAQEVGRDWAGQLQSTTPSQWRVAQAYLARAGAEALPKLERLAEGAREPLATRLKETLSLSLRNALPPAELCKYPKLLALCQPELKRARELAKPLFGAKNFDSGVRGLSPAKVMPAPLSPARQAIEDLRALRGFAVPVAVELLSDKEPASRTYGLCVLDRLNAIGQYEFVKPLLTDEGRIEMFMGCYDVKTTVGAHLAQRIKTGFLRPVSDRANEKYAIAMEAENYFDWLEIFSGADPQRQPLGTRLRLDAKTLESSSWDDFWRRARPVLEDAWDGFP